MSTPSPFQIAREASNNFGNAFKRVSDENAIEGILSEAMSTGNPEVVQNSIGKILSKVSPERQGVAIQYLQNTFSNLQKKQEQAKIEAAGKAAAQEAGYTYGAPPAVQGQQVKDKAKAARLSQYGLKGAQQSSQGIGQNVSNNGNVTPPFLPGFNGSEQDAVGFEAPNQIPNQQPQSPFKKFSKDQLTVLTGHPDKEISEPAKAELKQQQEQDKLDQKEKIRSREEELQFHKEGEKYDEELFKQAKIAKNQVDTIGNIEKAISSGNVTPTSLANVFKGFGKIGDKISEALINKDQATLLASIPQLLEGWKEVFGVRLSDADLKLLQDKLPSIGKTPEANRAIVKVLKKYADMTLLRSQIAKEVKEKNKGLRPLGYADKIETRFDEMVMPVKIINPGNGKEIEIPAYKVSDAIKAGGRLANEQL
jgi:hypothetical protein